jgi:hypothetical protein
LNLKKKNVFEKYLKNGFHPNMPLGPLMRKKMRLGGEDIIKVI